MIIFESIRFKNFLSFGNIDQHVDFLQAKKTLIVGANGQGKSTLIDAITFALFGKPFRKVNRGGLVNTINKKNCETEIDFDIKGTKYKIKRYQNPGLFEIYQDGSLIPQDASSRDYQKYLENDILGLNYRTFTQIVILGSGSYTQFMKLSTSAKREIIEDILDISVFSRMNELLKIEMREADTELQLLEKDMDMYKQQYKFMFDKSVRNAKSKENRINEKQEEIARLSALLITKSQLRDDIKSGKKKVENDSAIKKKKSKLTEFRVGINKNLQQVGSEISFYSDHDTCPKCKKELDKDFKEQRIAFLNKKKDEFKSALSKLNSSINDLADKIKGISEKKEENRKITEQISECENEIQQIKIQIDFLESAIKEIQAEDNELVSPDELEKLKNLVKQADGKLSEQHKAINIMKLGLGILKDNGAKIAIIKFYLPLINKTINEFLERFDFNVSFTFDENFDESMRARHIDTYKYGNFSEGERMRIDLSLMFTWREIAKKKNSASTNLLFFDEVLDSAMDISGLTNFMNIIDDYDPKVNLFIISHREGVEAGFDSVMEAKKEGNFSRYLMN